MRLALRILRPHSLTLTLTLSLSHCLTVSLISLISLISFSSLSSLSPLSLSLLSVSRLSVSLLSLLSQEDPGKEPHIKGSSPLPPKRAPCFFLPRCPPLSHSGALAFAPPLASSAALLGQLWATLAYEGFDPELWDQWRLSLLELLDTSGDTDLCTSEPFRTLLTP